MVGREGLVKTLSARILGAGFILLPEIVNQPETVAPVTRKHSALRGKSRAGLFRVLSAGDPYPELDFTGVYALPLSE